MGAAVGAAGAPPVGEGAATGAPAAGAGAAAASVASVRARRKPTRTSLATLPPTITKVSASTPIDIWLMGRERNPLLRARPAVRSRLPLARWGFTCSSSAATGWASSLGAGGSGAAKAAVAGGGGGGGGSVRTSGAATSGSANASVPSPSLM